MSMIGVIIMIVTYLLVAAVIGGILYFIIKSAVKKGMLDALEEWHNKHEDSGDF